MTTEQIMAHIHSIAKIIKTQGYTPEGAEILKELKLMLKELNKL